MGSSSSKVARTAASTARRQYPSTSSIPTNSSAAPPSQPRTTTAPPPPSSSNTPAPAPAPAQVHPDLTHSPPSSTRSEAIDLDGRDPQFGARLSQIGPVQTISPEQQNQPQPHPSLAPSPSSQQQGQSIFPHSPSAATKTNPALLIVEARERISRQWESESETLGRASFQGRTLIGAAQIRDVLSMRESGMESGEIERRLRLRAGLVKRLGVGSVVENA